jgi:hypothetical protein
VINGLDNPEAYSVVMKALFPIDLTFDGLCSFTYY